MNDKTIAYTREEKGKSLFKVESLANHFSIVALDPVQYHNLKGHLIEHVGYRGGCMRWALRLDPKTKGVAKDA
jgi:hypothetical protein